MAFTKSIIASDSLDASDLGDILGDFVAEGITTGFLTTVTSGLGVSVSSGRAVIKTAAGSLFHVISSAAESLTMTGGSTNYIFLHCDNGSDYLTVSTTDSTPSDAIKIAKVVAGSSSITSITNYRFSPRIVPSGVIIAWHGTLNSIPAGWALCDGNNGTPDLRARMLKSIDTSEDPGTTGGAATHTHSVTGAEGISIGSGAFSGLYYSTVETWPPYYEVAFIMKL